MWEILIGSGADIRLRSCLGLGRRAVMGRGEVWVILPILLSGDVVMMLSWPVSLLRWVRNVITNFRNFDGGRRGLRVRVREGFC